MIVIFRSIALPYRYHFTKDSINTVTFFSKKHNQGGNSTGDIPIFVTNRLTYKLIRTTERKSDLLRKKDISSLTDEKLLQLHKESGHTEYFGELFNRYIPLLYGVCLKYLHDADKSQDAVMQIFENLLPKVASYEIEVFRTWIHSVVKNHCLQILRKESKAIIVEFNTEIMESDEILHLFSEEEKDNDRIAALHRCMERLPDGQRISIRYFFIEEMSYADIVEQTGYSLSGVKSNIQNGKRNLKICIDKHTR